MRTLFTIAFLAFSILPSFGAAFPYITLNAHTNRVSDNGTSLTYNGSALTGGAYAPTTNTVYVNLLASGGSGTVASPWTGLESANLKATNTYYIWPAGVYLITNTVDLVAGNTNLAANTYHKAQGAVVRFDGSGVALRAANANGWSMNFGMSGFRVDCSNAVYVAQTPDSVVGSGMTNPDPIATVTKAAGHGYSNGDVIWVQSSSVAAYNGVHIITVVSPTVYTYRLRSGINVSTTPTGCVTWKATVAYQMQGIRNAHFDNLYAGNCILGYDLRALVTDDWDNIRLTQFEQENQAWKNTSFPGFMQPQCGMTVGVRIGTAADTTTTQTIRNLVLEGIGSNDGSVGLDLWECGTMMFDEGTAEGCFQDGVHINNSTMNIFRGWDTEANGGVDWYIFGDNIGLENCFNGGPLEFTGGYFPWMTGGRQYSQVTVDSNVNRAYFKHIQPYSIAQFTDNGINTTVDGIYYETDGVMSGGYVKSNNVSVANIGIANITNTISAGSTNLWKLTDVTNSIPHATVNGADYALGAVTTNFVQKTGDTMTGVLDFVNGTAANPAFRFTGVGGGTGNNGLYWDTGAQFPKMSVGANDVMGWPGAGSAYIYGANGLLYFVSAPLAIRAEAADTLGLWNGANGQTINLYNTRTDASNYERGFMRWNGNVLQIGAEALGTGTNRPVQILFGTNVLSNSGTNLTWNGTAITVP